ncbi:MAG: NAD-dependent epimerase/dehydratase family protein [Deltaproteobacteria bacterium]|nr:NAD-dependent epimerase/dehydratase family protein [Deltaproteobacteria bacterium]
MAKTAFVTGGTGFIGINLVELLVREGWRVTALHRPTSDLTYLKRFPIDLAEGSITDRESLERAIPAGTEVVFHVAGDTSFWSKGDAQQDAINIDGTRHMVEVAASKGVRTFIHTSSDSAWGRVKGTVTEETPLQGKDSWINYERSKHLGELEALEGVALGMKVVSLNPVNVVGPYDANTWGRIFFMLRDKALPAVSSGVMSITHVRDVVRAHLSAVSQGKNGERYILAGEDHSVAEFVAEFARLSGTKTPRVAPAWVLKIFGRVSVMVAAITGNEPDVTPEIAAITSQTETVLCSDKAIRELGYRVQPMAVAVQDNYDWLVKEGFLPKAD